MLREWATAYPDQNLCNASFPSWGNDSCSWGPTFMNRCSQKGFGYSNCVSAWDFFLDFFFLCVSDISTASMCSDQQHLWKGLFSWLPVHHWSLIVVYLYPGGYYVCLDALLIRNTENDEKRSFGNSQTCDNCLSCKSCWGLTEIVAADASVPVIPCFPNIPQAWLLFWQHYKSSVERERNTSEESKAFTYLENWH